MVEANLIGIHGKFIVYSFIYSLTARWSYMLTYEAIFESLNGVGAARRLMCSIRTYRFGET